MIRTRRAAALLATALLAAIAAAAAPKPPGQLIDIGGRKLHLVCQGKGTPTVILESGLGEFSIDWALTMPRIARTIRVCAWDRAGYAWSDMSPGFEQFPAVAADMRAVLRKAGINPPWILAGHAVGALYARDYQRRFPAEVAGLVLVDPTPEEDFQVQMFGNTVSLIDMADHDLVAWPVRPFAPSRTSPPPARPAPSARPVPPFDQLPHGLQSARVWALGRFFDELDGLSADQAHAVMESERSVFTILYNNRHNPATSPLTLPIAVLSRGRGSNDTIGKMQDELTRLSRNTSHRTVENSGTQIQIEQPETVASAAIEMAKTIAAAQK